MHGGKVSCDDMTENATQFPNFQARILFASWERRGKSFINVAICQFVSLSRCVWQQQKAAGSRSQFLSFVKNKFDFIGKSSFSVLFQPPSGKCMNK
jgi:hypothetical protein